MGGHVLRGSSRISVGWYVVSCMLQVQNIDSGILARDRYTHLTETCTETQKGKDTPLKSKAGEMASFFNAPIGGCPGEEDQHAPSKSFYRAENGMFMYSGPKTSTRERREVRERKLRQGEPSPVLCV